MANRIAALVVAAVSLAACGQKDAADQVLPAPASIAYPETKTVNVVEEIHGERIADPYRWLEDDVRENPEVAAWVEAQNVVTNAYLDGLSSRNRIKARLQTLWNYEKFGLPLKRGSRYFFRRNSGLQNQYVLYVQDGLDGEPRALLDPNQWSDDGATALGEYEPSPDGARLAYAVQDGGSDWRTVRVLDVATGETLADKIDWVKFSNISWAADGSGFYYERYPAPEAGEAFQSLNLNQKVYFHRVGEAQSLDRLVYERPQQPEQGFNAEVSDDGRWLVVTVWKGTDNRYEVVLLDLENPQSQQVALVTGFENDYSYIGNLGDRFFFVTDRDAPKGRIVAVDIASAAAGAAPQWMEITPEAEGSLTSVSLVGGRLIANYLEDVKTVVHVLEADGAPVSLVSLPGVGTAYGFGGEPDDPETFYGFTSFNAPDTIYRLDVATGESSVFKKPDTPFDPSEYAVEQVFYESKDGTRVPMFISHRKDVDLKKAPTLLYGYGGFNISMTPGFSVTRLAWMEMGGVYAVANIRGGGEYGKAWHDGGRLLNKQNVFDDFIGAAEYLISKGVTAPDKLAIMGGSNGGLLVGAVVNQRPDLFAAAAPLVGVMDMLRFNKFTAGRFWVDDYGDPANPEDFANLRAYSPYHNIRPGTDYPAMLAVTADTDDRVVPGHSFKYIAAVQAADLGPEPHLIRIETRAGHGSGKPTDKTIQEYADIWAFFARHTGLSD